MKMKRVAILATTGAVLISAGLLIPKVAFADEDLSGHENFIEKLAERFNLSEDELEEVFTEVREEHKAERQAEREEAITSAYESGDLTDRQMDILSTMAENRPERGEMNVEERPSPEDRQNRMIEILSEAGLEVTSEELDELHEVMQDLGLGMRGKGGHKGMRGMNI